MSAVEVSIADAMVSDLDGASLSQTFTPVRSYADWVQPLEQDDALKESTLYVDVVPVATAQEIDAASQVTLAYTCPIDVAVRYKFGQDKMDSDNGRVVLAEIDKLMLLVQEIHELFTLRRMQSFNDAAWQGTKRLVAPHKPHLRDFRQFTGIVRVTFTAHRKVV
jgi:hypothetical protein